MSDDFQKIINEIRSNVLSKHEKDYSIFVPKTHIRLIKKEDQDHIINELVNMLENRQFNMHRLRTLYLPILNHYKFKFQPFNLFFQKKAEKIAKDKIS